MATPPDGVRRDLQYYKFCLYGFLKDLRFFEPFMMLFFLERGFTFLMVGTLYALREILVNLLEIPTGVMADALGRRRTMVLSFGSYIVAFVLYFFSQDFVVLVGATVCFAFGEAFRTGTHKAMIFEYLKIQGWQAHKAWYYGHTRSWSQAGGAVSAFVAAALVLWQGSYAPVFLWSIVPYVLDLLLMLSYPKALDGDRAVQPGHGAGRRLWAVLGEFFQAFRQPAILRTIGNQALYSGYYKALKDFLQPLIKALALGMPFLLDLAADKRTAILVGLIYGGMYVLTVFSARQAGNLASRFDHPSRALNLTLFAGLGLGVASGLLEMAGLHLLAVLLYLGIILVENARKPIGIAQVSDYVDSAVLASTLSAESQAETLCAALIAWALGALADWLGLGPGILVVSLACMGLGLLVPSPRPAAKG